MKNKVSSFLIALILCAVVAFCHLMARLVIQIQNISDTGALYIEAAFLLIPNVFFAIWMMVTGVNRKRYFLQMPSLKGLLWYLPMLLTLIPFIVGGVSAPESTLVAMGQLLVCVVIALTETLGFHGLVYARLKKAFSKRTSAILVVVLFSMCHGIMALTGLYSHYTWSSFVAITVFAYVSMILVIETKSLLPILLIRYAIDLLARSSTCSQTGSIIINCINFSFMLIYGTIALVIYIKRKKNALDPCDSYSSSTVMDYEVFESNEEVKSQEQSTSGVSNVQ